MRRTVFTAIVTVAIGFSAMPTWAQEEAGRADRLIDALAQCRTIADATPRLACLDAASAAILSARARKEVVVIDREGVREAKRSIFGFSLPKIRLFGRGTDAEDVEPEVTSIDSKVTAVALVQRTFWTFRLANGSQWQATEAFRYPPNVGDEAHIEAGILGSYRASFGGRSAGKVKRVR